MKMVISRNSPGVQWLGLCSHSQEPRVRELGSHKPQGPTSPTPPPKKIISKLNFRAVNFFFLSHGQNLSLKVLYHVVSPPGEAG